MTDHPSYANRLARFVAAAEPGDVPEGIRRKAARHVLDTLACGLAGAASSAASRALDLMLAVGEAGDVPVWGTGRGLTPRAAALVNGVACHAFELDDAGGCDHSGAVVLPAALAALALADREVSGREFLLAVVLGYDVARRVLEACGGYEPHNGAGWHSTATCGPFGAAAAAARLLHLNDEGIAHALGHAASFSGGLWAFIHDGSETKRIHAGRAAEGGLFAALLARAGITGPTQVFEDVWGGFLPTYARESADPDALQRDLGERWRIERVAIKPYASCRSAHAAVDALGQLIDRHDLDRSTVRTIEVRLSGFLDGMCGGRDLARLAPAQMSLPYALAARLALGKADLAAYSAANRASPDIRDIMERISLTVAPEIPSSDEPYVQVETTDGRRHEARVTDPLGSPTNPMSEDAFFAKVRGLAAMALSPDAAARLESGILDIERDPDVRWLGGGLAAGGRPPIFS